MKSVRRNLLKIAAACYRAAYLLHHKVALRPDLTLQKKLGSTKLIVVGSYRTGGAGKTPFCLWLAKRLSQPQNGPHTKGVAILCHSYAYDEIQMLREEIESLGDGGKQTGTSNFIEVIGTGNRHRTVLQLLQRKTPPAYIICDDGFEDSRLTGAVNIILRWKEDLPSEGGGIGQLWPAGPCRSLPEDHPQGESTLNLSCEDHIEFHIDRIANAQGESLPQSLGRFHRARAVCGIGSPKRFLKDLDSFGIPTVDNRLLKDHDRSFPKKLAALLEQFPGDAIIITQKDACRLDEKMRNHPNVFTVYQKVSVSLSAIHHIDLLLAGS